MRAPSNSYGNQYVDYVDLLRIPNQESFLVERHRPTKFRVAYHHHASVEVNFLDGCRLEYSFSGRIVHPRERRMTVFWGSIPHGVTDVFGRGMIVNVYVSFAQVLKWGLPSSFVDALLGGGVVCCRDRSPVDRLMFHRWADEYPTADAARRQLILGEIEMRFRRMALEERETLLAGSGETHATVGGGATMRYVEEMLRFVADNYGSTIYIADVADHVGLSSSYAMSLFRRVVGVPIKEHITRIRLSHAQMLLASSDKKILSIAMDSGFGSLSSFYEAFQLHAQKTPAAFRREARQ